MPDQIKVHLVSPCILPDMRYGIFDISNQQLNKHSASVGLVVG